MKQTVHNIQKSIRHSLELQYLRYLPTDYRLNDEKKWPLILFLHGAGERGSNLDQVRLHGIAKVVEQCELPFITLSPQCPVNHWWSDYLPVLDAMIEDAIETLNVDPARVYLTGLSMGGFGTWHMAVEYPHRFAAIVPICGGNSWMYSVVNRVEAIRGIPTWVFHGEEDDIVPLRASEEMVAALQACGGDVRLTTYPGTGHDSWTKSYDNPELYSWLLSHSKKGR